MTFNADGGTPECLVMLSYMTAVTIRVLNSNNIISRDLGIT